MSIPQNTITNKIKARNYLRIFFSLIVTILGSIIYLFLRFKKTYLLKVSEPIPFFFLGIGPIMTSNFIIDSIFFFLNIFSFGIETKGLKKWKSLFEHSLSIIICIFFTLIFIFDKDKNNTFLIDNTYFLFTIASILIHVCLLNLLIQVLNIKGVCNAFSLIYLIDITESFSKNIFNLNLNYFFKGLFLFFSSFFCILLMNIKWSVPIENSNFDERYENTFFERKEFTLKLKSNFSFLFLYYFNQFLSFLLMLIFFFTRWEKWNSIKSLFRGWMHIKEEKEKIIKDNEKESLYIPFFVLNEKKHILNANEIKKDFAKYGTIKYSASFFSLFLARMFLIWFSNIKNYLNSEEIAKRMRNDGVFIEGIPYGLITKTIIKKNVNKMFFLWILAHLFFNFIFDNTMNMVSFSYFSWCNWVNTAEEIIDQSLQRINYLSKNT